ncbi:hypothetical protein AGDE_16087 [Angomonas deanei]|nr:hypothetical protein AGDE_16087 [Angomonas deanei]|eukprot:EPY17730.1 hypothetical protein AGDE_16087 [Angomonas deanei]
MEEKQEVEEKKVIEAILDEIRGETPENEKERDVENEKLKKEEEMKNGAFGIFSAFSFAPIDEVSRGAVYKPTITLKEEKKKHTKKEKE